jgi:uncharacterized protein YndB with AHSA1/START domain
VIRAARVHGRRARDPRRTREISDPSGFRGFEKHPLGYHADLTINAPIDSVFAAVSSVEGLSGWWTTDTGGSPEPGGELPFTFSDGVAVMRVEERTPSALERWTCLGHSGQPEWAHTTVIFRLTEVNPAATRLEFTHGGLRPQLDCYEHCSAGWSYLMRSLASYAETGTGHPVSP